MSHKENIDKLKKLLLIKKEMSSSETRDFAAFAWDFMRKLDPYQLQVFHNSIAKNLNIVTKSNNIPHYITKITGFAPQVVIDPMWVVDVRMWGVVFRGQSILFKYIEGGNSSPDVHIYVHPNITQAEMEVVLEFLADELEAATEIANGK